MKTLSQYPHRHRPVPMGKTQFGEDFKTRVETTRTQEKIKIDRYSYKDDVEVSRSSNRASVDRYGYQDDVEFKTSSSRISVDRYSFKDDVEFKRSSSRLNIDRYSYKDDVEIKFSSSRIDIDKYGYADDVSLVRRGDRVEVKQGHKVIEKFPVSMMPGGSWPTSPKFSEVSHYIDMEPQTAGALDRWFQSGPDMDDIVRIDSGGNTNFYDQNFR